MDFVGALETLVLVVLQPLGYMPDMLLFLETP
jgi:hypothetical protein